MRTLHIAPGYSAGGSLRQAIQIAGSNDEVLAFLDDLSCGPIDSDDPSARAKWWAEFFEWPEFEGALRAFWSRVEAAEERLVVWFGRHSANEHAFFLAWADRLGKRPYYIVDVTGMRVSFRRQDGSDAQTQPARAVSVVPSTGSTTLLGSERLVTPQEAAERQRHWRRLRSESAPFRIVTAAGLASAQIDHFDPSLLGQSTPQWQKTARVIGNTMVSKSESYFQVGDLMLQGRIVALVNEGKLLADGDPWDMQSCQVRLPDRR
jgi:hypothetical protein